MTLNCTLIIQAINFGFTYWLLRSFIFKPIVAHLTAQEAHDCAYKERISLLEFNKERVQNEYVSEQEAVRRELEKYYPTSPAPQVFSFDDLQLKTDLLRPSEQKKIELKNELADVLREKVIV